MSASPEPQSQRRRSRYERPRRSIRIWALVLGGIWGVVGGLYYAWTVDPIEEFDTAPWQLREADQADYIVALMLAYGYDGDLARTVETLAALRLPGDPITYVADLACDLARSGYVDSASGENGIRAMMRFYQLQGRSGCADELIQIADVPRATQVIVAATATLTPLPTKTPTSLSSQGGTPTPVGVRVVPTDLPQRAFRLARLENFCDADIPGVIEVYVQEPDGLTGVPGTRVRVTWESGESVFITGLKPERGRDYADFQMEGGRGYIIELPGLSDPSTQQIVAAPCTTENGVQSLTSYRAVYRPSFN